MSEVFDLLTVFKNQFRKKKNLVNKELRRLRRSYKI